MTGFEACGGCGNAPKLGTVLPGVRLNKLFESNLGFCTPKFEEAPLEPQLGAGGFGVLVWPVEAHPDVEEEGRNSDKSMLPDGFGVGEVFGID